MTTQRRNGRDGGRREAATDTAIGRRGKVPMGAGAGITAARLGVSTVNAKQRKRADAGSEQRGDAGKAS